MPRHSHDFVLDIDRDRLFRALADLERWPEWDDDIRAVALEGLPAPGRPFTLHLKDGSAVTLTIEAFEPPAVFVDCAQLPLARMLSRHELLPEADADPASPRHHPHRPPRLALGPPRRPQDRRRPAAPDRAHGGLCASAPALSRALKRDRAILACPHRIIGHIRILRILWSMAL